MATSKKSPEKVESKALSPLVEVQQVHVDDIRMVIHGYGTVSPKVQVEVVPQVSGKIVWVNPRFKAGEFTAAEQTLVKIDPRDYELVVQQAQAGVAEAMVKLDMEKAEAEEIGRAHV